MRVFAGPRIDVGRGSDEEAVAWALAGEEGEVLSLREAGVATLHRPLTAAEVERLRQALADSGALVGYVCKGVAVGPGDWESTPGSHGGGVQVVAVSDHANLTWRSPLTGPNDDRVGPRFPSMTGIYEVGAVLERLATRDGIIVRQGVVAGVSDDRHPNAYETEIARACGHLAASSELVPVVIVAAHMGLRVAAAVVTKGESQEEETGSGRS